MSLRVHVVIPLLLLFMFPPSSPSLASDLDGSSWSGKEQRGLFSNAIVSSSEHTEAQKTQRWLKESHIEWQIQEGVA